MEECRQNMKLFIRRADKLRQLGHEPVNPVGVEELTEESPKMSYIEYIKRDLILLLGCSGATFLTNWEESPGAQFERTLANYIGLTEIEINE